ncbi:MAG: peroxidase family protein [Planctomycetota bacterium]|nr:MAG: peroxidase family protein [Planctomycetota bacterium]
MQAHGAAARQLLGEQSGVVEEVFADATTANVSDKLRALLAIAEKVRIDGRLVTDEDVRVARDAGADDKAIHDTVLIAAMFSMFNRYVDGLATWTPHDPKVYEAIGERLATKGYGSRFRESE